MPDAIVTPKPVTTAADQPRRLYLDNAATSYPKPPQVTEAMTHYATKLGASAGRGAYREAIETGDLLLRCRRAINDLIHGEDPRQCVFTLNCSDALNIALRGLVDPFNPGHAVCTEVDHNSILRPIHAMAEQWKLNHTAVPVDSATTVVDPDDIRRAIRSDTKFVAITQASNVTGAVQPIREIGQICREMAVPLVVDAAQSLGHVPIDVQADCIDVLAAPGHKAAMGPLGTGFLYLRPGMEKVVRPLREGGT
ncbi:MAG: aminotransferase class V-fold PLP-dependent enzyme, partial [Planctomycetota bacterium]